MQKFITLLTCCIFVTYCYCQPLVKKDSLSTIPLSKQNTATLNIAKPELAIYPNPANSKITLQVKNFDPGMVSVKLLDTKGKLVKEDKRLLTNGTEDIIMFLMLKAGIYFIMVSEPGKVAREKAGGALADGIFFTQVLIGYFEFEIPYFLFCLDAKKKQKKSRRRKKMLKIYKTD